MQPKSAEVGRWIAKAYSDRRSAEALIQLVPPATDTAAFHVQQAAEKLLKAVLVANSIDFERTHDLVSLLVECCTVEARFGELRAKLEPLSAFAVRFRYPGPNDPTLAAARKALAVVDDLWEFAKTILPVDSWAGIAWPSINGAC